MTKTPATIARETAKALVGAATPIVTTAAVQLITEASTIVTAAIAGLVTWATVWATPNKPPA